MNITKQAFMVLHIGFFFVLILLLLSCANVKFNCDITNIESPNIEGAVEECRDNPTAMITKEF
jgi:hypothetical protein